jgi:membrane protein implicated in regulation of membrane protease activity
MSRRVKLAAWSQRRSSRRRGGHHTPRLWPVPLAAGVALLAAALAAGAIYLSLRAIAVPAAKPPEAPVVDVLELVRTTITVTGLVGVVLAGVYAYRKQRLAEGDGRRADEVQFAARYSAAAEQLGHQSAPVRLAGAYALARLADDWPDERQACVDVLCAYLRLPYEPDPGSPKYKADEREVRRIIIRIIRDHLRSDRPTEKWSQWNFSFERAVFDTGDLTGAHFTEGWVSFHRARFVSGNFWFDRVHFAGAHVRFTLAQFEGATVHFNGAKFASGDVQFNEAQFSGGTVTFEGAELTGCTVGFDGAVYSGGAVEWGPFPPPPGAPGSPTP